MAGFIFLRWKLLSRKFTYLYNKAESCRHSAKPRNVSRYFREKTKNPIKLNDKPTHEEIYEKLSSLFNVKFKVQLKDSPIVFDNFLQVKNVVLKNENYVILFRREKEILKFKDRNDFIDNFINFIDIKIKEFNEEFEDLQNFERRSMGIKYDENEVYMRHESIGHGTMKLNQIRNKLINLK